MLCRHTSILFKPKRSTRLLTWAIRGISQQTPRYEKHEKSPMRLSFWQNKITWTRASRNTLNCLVGCNIGDFGAIIALNHYYPDLPFSIVMPIAMVSGLTTSIMLESALLRYREGLSWKKSVEMATSMSFISMLAMEFAENATDYLLTGGNASIHEPWFWQALLISTAAGFLTPLPYNYYQLEKYGKSCHQVDQQDNDADGDKMKFRH